MAEQWQIRRGTTAENDAFTGAIGELTMDTDTKGLRIHDGSTQGGFEIDSVVYFQKPTAENNYTWARKYASGWVEQGGQANTTTSGQVVNFPITMSDTNYQVQITCKSSPSNYSTGIVSSGTTTTSMKISTYNEDRFCCWEVKGMAA